MRNLETRLERLESQIADIPYVPIWVPFGRTEEDKAYCLQKHLGEGGNPDAPVQFVTNYSPEFKERFYLDKALFRGAA